MERIIKGRLVPFHFEVENPIFPDETMIQEKNATHGMVVTTAEAPDDPDEQDVNTIYGVREDEIRRYDQTPGLFYTEQEVKAMESGYLRSPNMGTASAIEPARYTPIALEDMDEQLLAQYIQTEQASVEELLELVAMNPDKAQLVINAEAAATGGEPRDGLLEGVSHILGSYTAPEGSEGVEGTEGGHPSDQVGLETQRRTPQEIVDELEAAGVQPEPPQLPEGDEPPDGGGGQETTDDGSESTVAATDAAVEYAAERGIDLAQVTGTGSDGRVTKPDIEKYEADQENA